MSDAETFVTRWSTVWRGPKSDPELYTELLHVGCPLINPLNPTRRVELPQFFESVLADVPNIRVVPTRWAETNDGSVLIEWINTGTVGGSPIEIRGVDRCTIRDGKATEGYSYFDPRPFLPSASTGSET